jgi:hypothetical protein
MLRGSYNLGVFCWEYFLLKKQSGHSIDNQNSALDRALGLDRDITRRDFLNSTLLASGGLLLNAASPAQLLGQQGGNQSPGDDWSGYGGIGDYAKSNGNTMAVLEAGHRIRNQEFESLPPDILDTGETYDCVVVGGGISGLAAALIFQQLAGKDKSCLVIDNHPIFGGEAKRNEFLVDGHRLIAHQGSAFFPVPYPHSFIARFYDSIGLKAPRLEYQKWGGADPEMKLSTTPYLGSAKRNLFWNKIRQAPRHLGLRRKSMGASTDFGEGSRRTHQVRFVERLGSTGAPLRWRRDLAQARLNYSRGLHAGSGRH